MRTAYLVGLLSLFALGLFLSPAAAEEKDKAAKKAKDLIVGKWTHSKEENSGTIEFTKDGKVLVNIAKGDQKIEASGTYKFVADDKMEVELKFGDQTKKDTLTVKVTAEELKTTDSKDKTETFKRVK